MKYLMNYPKSQTDKNPYTLFIRTIICYTTIL